MTPKNIADPNVALAWDNLQYVCHECHDRFEGHGVARSLTERVEFDGNGEPIPPIEKTWDEVRYTAGPTYRGCAGRPRDPPGQ